MAMERSEDDSFPELTASAPFNTYKSQCLFVHLTENLHWPSRSRHNGCFVERMFVTALKYRVFLPERPVAFLQGSSTHTYTHTHTDSQADTHGHA